MNKIEKLRDFILKNGYKGTQAFNSRNIAGDSMVNIYEDKENGVIVDFVTTIITWKSLDCLMKNIKV